MNMHAFLLWLKFNAITARLNCSSIFYFATANTELQSHGRQSIALSQLPFTPQNANLLNSMQHAWAAEHLSCVKLRYNHRNRFVACILHDSQIICGYHHQQLFKRWKKNVLRTLVVFTTSALDYCACLQRHYSLITDSRYIWYISLDSHPALQFVP